MKQILYLFLALFFHYSSLGQSVIHWSPEYQLQLEDFRSQETEINPGLRSNTISLGTGMDLSFQMNTYEFMFTRNFNSKVKNTFNKNAAVITATDTATALQLVKYGQYCFDLTELYSRMLRRELYEQKKAFSSANFFRPIFNRIQEELLAENARVSKVTDLGRQEPLLNLERQKVLQQIHLLSDFCFDCKPKKKKG